MLLFFKRMILNSGRHTQPDPQSCRLGGRRGESPKTNTFHWGTSTFLVTPSFSCVQTPDIVLLEIHNPGGGGNLQLRRAKEIHWTFLQKSCRICRQGLLEVCTCEKLHARAYGNLTPYGSTLWEGWSDMPLIIVVQFYARKIGREHSTCCGRNLCIVTSLYHNILLVFGLIILWHPEMSLISVDLIVAYWSVLHLILDSTWV